MVSPCTIFSCHFAFDSEFDQWTRVQLLHKHPSLIDVETQVSFFSSIDVMGQRNGKNAVPLTKQRTYGDRPRSALSLTSISFRDRCTGEKNDVVAERYDFLHIETDLFDESFLLSLEIRRWYEVSDSLLSLLLRNQQRNEFSRSSRKIPPVD